MDILQYTAEFWTLSQSLFYKNAVSDTHGPGYPRSRIPGPENPIPDTDPESQIPYFHGAIPTFTLAFTPAWQPPSNGGP